MSATLSRPLATSPEVLPPGHPDEFLGQGIPPVQQIQVMLRRKKEQGIIITCDAEWERLWTWCTARARYEHDHDERHSSKLVVAWSEPYFRAAYEDAAPIPSLGVMALLSALL